MKAVVSAHRIYELKVGDEHVERLREVAPGVDILLVRSEEEAGKEIRDAEIHFGGLSPETFRAAGRLLWAQTTSAGIERMLFPEMVESEVVLSNASGAYDVPIAEHAFALMLALTRDLRPLIRLQAKHIWQPRWEGSGESARIVYSGEELTGRTVGIVGLGGIGLEVARKAHGFGMRVVATDPTPKARPEFVERIWDPTEVGEMLAASDVVVIAAPMTPATEGMIGADELARIKPGAYLINVSRGRIVSEKAMMEALTSGRLAGAGLDVTGQEPLPPDSALWDMENVVITPHIAGISEEAERRIWDICRENLRRYLAGEALMNVVDKRRGY